MSTGAAAAQPAAEVQRRIVQAWQRQLAGRHAAPPGVRCIETHASYVLLAGGFAYKLKKAVDLGFLDFRTLAQRRHFCHEEWRLNRRTAPELYVDVRPLGGPPEAPTLLADGAAGSAPVLDWVLCMVAFDEAGLWDRLAARGALRAAHIDALAEELASLHVQAAIATGNDPRGRAQAVRSALVDSLDALQPRCRTPAETATLQALRQWENQAFAALRDDFDARERAGRVRECHGDLHLGNVTEHGGRTCLFDCLEFSAALRFTDVMSDVAFMAMDLRSHGLSRLAHRFVNAYLERSGDFDGLRVLRYYAVHRALVRAKVAALRAQQLGPAGDVPALATQVRTLDHYLDVATAESRPVGPWLLITHGLPGSGKTLLTQSLLELTGAVRLRADVERKRLFGLDALDRPSDALRERLYSPDASEATQARLRVLAGVALRSGYPVILDATFGSRAARRRALALADEVGVPGLILDFRAGLDTLRARVRQRARRADDASDAGLAELELLHATAEPLTADESAMAESVDAEQPVDELAMPARWAALLQRLGTRGT